MARDLELGILRAVKQLPLSDRKEAELMKNLNHPGIPRMVDFVETGQFCYLVMEYIRGWSLRKCLSDRLPFTKKQILKMGIEAAEILEYLHHLSPPVCYGDLKPDNLILSETGRLYLVDYGSARRIYADQKREVLGTPGYAAPEQFEGHLRPSSDVFSLGRTLKELWEKGYGRPLLLSLLFHHFLNRCCQTIPDSRYPDITSAKTELEKLYTDSYLICFLGSVIFFLSMLVSFLLFYS